MRLVLLVFLLGLGARCKEEEREITWSQEGCQGSRVGCRCQLQTLTCCRLDTLSSSSSLVPGQKPPSCPSNCSITSILIYDSTLGPEELSPDWLESRGICGDSVRRLSITNCSLAGLKLGGLPMLTHLQVEGTTGPGWLLEPPPSVISLHLGGASWPCMAPDPSKKNTSDVLQPSKTSLATSAEVSLTFGVCMSWLLEKHWANAWQDANKTLCGVHESESAKDAWYQGGEGEIEKEGMPRTLLSFLNFTEKTVELCPLNCTCGIAKSRVKFAHHEVKPRSLEVAVVCSDLSITELPLFLPSNTISLDLSYNQISSLEKLSEQNPTYEKVTSLDLSHNLLNDLEGLETSWMKERGAHFLNLRENKLTELDLQTLEPIMARSQEGAKFFLAGNPWSCNCHNIKTFQEFLLKYNDIIVDGDEMRCEEYSGEALEQVDYKTICSSTAYGLLVFCSLELLLLVAVIIKLTCDCVEYKRTGNLPWCARKLCWSVPGIPRPHWTSPRLPSSFCNVTRATTTDSPGSVGQGSSGYLTSSSGGSQGGRPGGRETAVVRFLPQQQ